MYADFYGLTGEPFLLTPDYRFYFDSSVHAQAMAHLLYGLGSGEGFIVITGEVGAGKTTIVQYLCATIDSGRIVPAHIVTTLLSGGELIRMVCSAFGIKEVPESKDAALGRLRGHIEHLHRNGRKPLIIVDEAQNLSMSALEELRMLSNFQIDTSTPCQIFLVGQPQFRTTISHPDLEQLRQRVIASYHLGPLSTEECEKYVTHRLRHVGWKGDPVFDSAAMSAIYYRTNGIPRRINTLCSRVLLLGVLENLHAFTADDIARVADDLQNENGAGLVAVATTEKINKTFVDHVNISAVAARIGALEVRLDLQEKLLRHVAAGIAKIVDRSEPTVGDKNG